MKLAKKPRICWNDFRKAWRKLESFAHQTSNKLNFNFSQYTIEDFSFPSITPRSWKFVLRIIWSSQIPLIKYDKEKSDLPANKYEQTEEKTAIFKTSNISNTNYEFS